MLGNFQESKRAIYSGGTLLNFAVYLSVVKVTSGGQDTNTNCPIENLATSEIFHQNKFYTNVGFWREILAPSVTFWPVARRDVPLRPVPFLVLKLLFVSTVPLQTSLGQFGL